MIRQKKEKFAHLSWVTWANRSQSLLCYEWPEPFAHGWYFDMSDSLTLAHLSWAIWVNERWENSLHWCTPWSLTLWWETHGGAWLCSMMHTAELELQTTEIFEKFGSLDSAVWCTQRSKTLRYDAHRGVWFCGVHHTAELDYFKMSVFVFFQFVTSFNYLVLKNVWSKKDSWNNLWHTV